MDHYRTNFSNFCPTSAHSPPKWLLFPSHTRYRALAASNSKEVFKWWNCSSLDIKSNFEIFGTEADGNLIAWVLWKVLGNLINAQIIPGYNNFGQFLKPTDKRGGSMSRLLLVRAGGGRWPNKFPALCGETFCAAWLQEKLQSSVNSRLESLFHAGRSGQELWARWLVFHRNMFPRTRVVFLFLCVQLVICQNTILPKRAKVPPFSFPEIENLIQNLARQTLARGMETTRL